MNPFCLRIVRALAVVLALCATSRSWAGDKDKKSGKETKTTIVIQLDASKVPPALLKNLLELSRSTDTLKKPIRSDDEGRTPKKGTDKKPNIVQVDLNKLSPDLAKRLRQELAGSTSKAKKDDDDGKSSKGKAKRDDDDDDGRKSGKGKAKRDDDDDDGRKKSKGKAKRDDDNDARKNEERERSRGERASQRAKPIAMFKAL